MAANHITAPLVTMEHNDDYDSDDASDGNTWPTKLQRNDAGRTTTKFEQKKETTQDNLMSEAEKLIEGLAKKLHENLQGLAEVVYNSIGLGNAMKHLYAAFLSHPDIYPLPDSSPDANNAPREEAIATEPVTSEAEVKRTLTKEFVESIQDPMWSRGLNDADPILQLTGMRIIVGGSTAGRGRQLSPFMLTLIDGSAKYVNTRIAVVRTREVASLRRGYLLKLKQFHRMFLAHHCDTYSSAGLGLLEYDVVGAGPVPTEFMLRAEPYRDVAVLQSQVAASINEDTNAAAPYDTLSGWDDNFRRPEIYRRDVQGQTEAAPYMARISFPSASVKSILWPKEI